MASAPPFPPSEDALPTYEEAILNGVSVNPVARSYDSLPRSRANTGDYRGVPSQAYQGQHEEEDAETALLKAELQRLKQENLESKKQLLRQEIQNEILKAGSHPPDTQTYESFVPPPMSYPATQTTTPVQHYTPPQPLEGDSSGSEEEKSTLGQTCCCIMVFLFTIFLVWVFAYSSEDHY